MRTATSNGQVPRKNLGEQIDRLDSMLDGLGEALNESVADAVRQAVGQAVKEAVTVAIKEVLSSPELLAMALARHAPAEPLPQPEKPAHTTLFGCIAGAWNWVYEAATGTTSKALSVLHFVWEAALDRLRQAGGWAAAHADKLAAAGLAGLAALLGYQGATALAVAAGCAGGVVLALPQLLKRLLGLCPA